MATYSRMRWAGLSADDFQLVTTYENSSFCKPNPDYYREILGKLNLKPEECLMVGDSLTSDILGGIRAEIATCWVNPQKKAGRDDIRPDYEIESLSQLDALLDTL